MKPFFVAFLMLNVFGCTQAQVKYNGSMETLTADKTRAAGWATYFQPEQQTAYPVMVDSLVKQEGKYSVRIEKVKNDAEFGVIDYNLPYTFKGHEVELRGYLKTENITSGYAGLWLRIDGTTAFDNMQNRGVKGTTDWKEYSIKLPYDADNAINIHTGALLAGNGKVWADNFRLYIDGKPVERAKVFVKELTKAEKDTTFKHGSKIDTIKLDKQQITNLTALGEVWGFLKYHHPAVAQGNYNWDAELFRIMPMVIKATNNQSLSAALEKWVDQLGTPPVCKSCSEMDKYADIKLKPDYDLLFTGTVLSKSLTQKLTYILNNRNTGNNYYIDMVGEVGNPLFMHEDAYTGMSYPDVGYRLLCLYRYWNMIQYFSPYKHLIGENWNAVLPDGIPKFVAAANATDYSLQTLALIARIHDTHANIWSNNKALNNFKGKYAVPFQASFIEDKLVVTGYYNDTLQVKELVKPGDVIEQINGQPVTELIKKYLPYSAASNYDTQLRDMPKNFLLRGNNADFKLTVVRNGQEKQITISALPVSAINYAKDYNPDPKAPGYYLIDDAIGYVYPGRYKNADLPKIESLFEKTKGIIIDMRCYPAEFMPFTFVPYIKQSQSGFVKFTQGSVAYPGLFKFSNVLSTPGNNKYKGRVVVIVNATSQSQAEYTTMAFQSSSNVKVIGSTTAGADGNVSSIVLPGNIATYISGIGVYYPDGTETQRKGVKIDEAIRPTIKGVKEGRDELLERAKEIIRQP